MWAFITTLFTNPRTRLTLCRLCLSTQAMYRPVLFGSSSVKPFTYSPCVSDARHMSNAVHLWTVFVRNIRLRLPSAVSTELLTVRLLHAAANRSIRVDVSGRYAVIPPIGLPVFPGKRRLVHNLFHYERVARLSLP